MKLIQTVEFDESEKAVLNAGKVLRVSKQVGYIKQKDGSIARVKIEKDNNEPRLDTGFKLPNLLDKRPDMNETECKAVWDDLLNGPHKGVDIYMCWTKEQNKPLIDGVRRNPTIKYDGEEFYKANSRRVKVIFIPIVDDWREHPYDNRYIKQEILEDSAEFIEPSYSVLEEVEEAK